MKIRQSKILKNWLYIGSIFSVAIITLAIFVVIDGYNNTLESTQRFETFYLNEKKEDIRKEVLNRIDEIDFELNRLVEEHKNSITDNIHQIAWLMNHSGLNEIENDQERMYQVIKYYEEITSDLPGLYFAINEKGILLKSGTDQSLEGLDYLHAKDVTGNYYVQDILETKDCKDGKFVTYWWPKAVGGADYEKTSYCFYLEEFGIIIGTGFYEDDLQAELRSKFMDRLRAYYEDEENYIFVTQYDGIAVVAANPDVIGSKFDNKTEDGENLNDLMVKTAKQAGGGYITYTFYGKGSDVATEKISFVYGIDEWEVYIGLGFHNHDLNKTVADYAEEYSKEQIKTLITIIVIGVLFGILIILLIKRGIRLHKAFLLQEEAVYTKLLLMLDTAIIIVSNEGEILYCNDQAEKMLGSNKTKYIIDNVFKLDAVRPNIFRVENDMDRLYYVEIKEENMTFNQSTSQIYFINDVTDAYLKENALERIVGLDELTQLPNRRSLKNDFEDICFKKVEQVVLSMIDLDLFKLINDEYGHNVGDKVIIALAEVFNTRLRSSDQIYRYGGEEFIVIFKGVSVEKAKDILEDIKGKFIEYVKEHLDLDSSFSGGVVAVCTKDPLCQLDHAVKAADELLYQAKNSGRNKILM